MHRRTIFALIAGAAVLLPFSPGAFAETPPPAVMQKVHAAQQQVSTIGMEDYRKVVDSPGEALIIDVREPHEYAAGHVPGAVNIPRGVLEFKIWTHVGSPAAPQLAKRLYLQCQNGNRASLAAQSLAELGFTQTTAVLMNLGEWQKSGQPFVK